jgi:phage tail protein X
MSIRQAARAIHLRRSARAAVCALLMSLATTCAATRTAAPEVQVSMRRVDGHPQFDIHAEAYARTDAAGAWSVLTAYGRLAQFVPNLDSSRELPLPDAAPNEHVVEQHGYGQFLFIRQPIDLVLRVREQPMSAIDMTLQSGNMRSYHARWELEQQDDAGGPKTLLRYTGTIAPDFYVPGLFGSALMRRDLRAMLEAVVAEMEKAPAPQQPQPTADAR